MKTAELLLFLAFYLDFSQGSKGRNLKWGVLYIEVIKVIKAVYFFFFDEKISRAQKHVTL